MACLLASETEEGLNALKGEEISSGIASVVEKPACLCPLCLQLLIGEEGTMDIKVDDVVVAIPALCRDFAQVVLKRPVGSGP